MLLLCLLALLPFVCANSSSLRNRAFCAVSHEGDRARCAVVRLSYIMFSSLFSLVAPKHNETRELCERVCCVWVDAVRRPKHPGKLRSMIDEGNCFLHSSAVTVRHCRAPPPPSLSRCPRSRSHCGTDWRCASRPGRRLLPAWRGMTIPPSPCRPTHGHGVSVRKVKTPITSVAGCVCVPPS